ncbi:MAG: hypothetical protein JWL77_1401 [Chthonomonadaceae bacterium]|nr:hypothetical protein [Chthonomonadaceae bacterium]
MVSLNKGITLLAFVIGGSAVVSGGVQAQTAITNLFNTGVDAGGAKITASNTTTTDLHYTSTSPVFIVQNLPGAWVKSTASNYIAPDGNDGSSFSGGVYTFTYNTSFTLPVNVDPASVVIQGLWSTDNLGNDILINGTPTGLTSPGFTSFTGFTLPTTAFHAGTNTLGFTWSNQGGPGGLDVEFTTATFKTLPPGTPEPGVTALLAGLGVSLVGITRRRRRR